MDTCLIELKYLLDNQHLLENVEQRKYNITDKIFKEIENQGIILYIICGAILLHNSRCCNNLNCTKPPQIYIYYNSLY